MRIRERLCVELAGIRRDWEQWCACRGVTAGEGVRQLIVVALGDAIDGKSEAPAGPALRWTAVGDPRARLEIRLTHAELQTIEARAAASGLTSNRWIVALIRAQLTREPELGEREMQLLSESNQQLAVINRWLGQLVRDGMVGRTTPERGVDTPALRQQIDEHLRTVATVIRANLDRWSR